MYSADILAVFDISHKPLALKSFFKNYCSYNIATVHVSQEKENHRMHIAPNHKLIKCCKDSKWQPAKLVLKYV